MIRYLYVGLLRLHPQQFRKLYGQEILAIFDQAAAEGRAVPLLVEGVVSLFRQWLLRPKEPVAQHETMDALAFYISDESLLPPSRLLTGVVLSTVVFFVACLAIKEGGNPRTRPGTLQSRETITEPKILNGKLDRSKTPRNDITDRQAGERWAARTNLPAKPYPFSSDTSMVSKFARNYIQVVRLLHALDTDHDGIISAEEISHSAIVLKTLDTDHDSSLSPEECGFRGFPPGIGLLTGGNAEAAEQRRRFLLRVRPAFMRFHPILAALDADHDGQISASEIQNAPSALWTLDRNGDAQITEEEYLPDPVENELTIVMSHLDTDGDGKISREERLNSFAAGVRDLLDAADQDRNGVVTEQELRDEIRRRADYNRDGIVTWSEMVRAMSAGAFAPVSHRE